MALVCGKAAHSHSPALRIVLQLKPACHVAVGFCRLQQRAPLNAPMLDTPLVGRSGESLATIDDALLLDTMRKTPLSTSSPVIGRRCNASGHLAKSSRTTPLLSRTKHARNSASTVSPATGVYCAHDSGPEPPKGLSLVLNFWLVILRARTPEECGIIWGTRCRQSSACQRMPVPETQIDIRGLEEKKEPSPMPESRGQIVCGSSYKIILM